MGQLEEINEVIAAESMYGSENKESLLKKYNIPIQHFDFDYVQKCTDSKELERMLQILKSGQEGHYPELLQKVEEKLSEIKPNSRYIRKLTRVLNKDEVDEDSSKEIKDDLSIWLNDINRKNTELTQMKNTTKSSLPEVRKSSESKEEKKNDIPKRIKSTDYAAWDKYDVDTELLKMDLEEEKIKKEAEKMAKEKHTKSTVKFNKFATTAEASFEAERENVVANEYFKAGEYEKALEHYNNSIVYFPSATTFANRGAAHFSLKKYDDSIGDYIKALKYESSNHEYLLQLGKCYSALEKWSEVLDCAETVIKLDPNNKIAQKLAEKAKKSGGQIGTNKVRLSVVDVETKCLKTPKKSILKMEEKSELIPIPGSSKMSGPYYKVVRSDDPNVINKEKELINNYPKRMFMTNIEIGSDDEDYNNLITPLNSPWTKKDIRTSDTSNTKKVSKNFKNKSKKKICQKLLTLIATGKEEEKHQVETKNTSNSSCNIIEQQNGKSCNAVKIKEVVCDNAKEVHRSDTKENHVVNMSETSIETTQNDIGGGGEPFTEDNPTATNTNDINMPFSFIQAWQSVRRDGTYSGFASILRNLNLNRMTEVMGNKIDATILSEILNCLYRHFMVADEVGRVYSILLNLSRLQRFCIVAMFLSANDKRLVQNLFDFLKQHGDDLPGHIKDLYL
ncbi:rna (rna) polymerase ii associated protein [Holotrichia oblita]|uniref:Rna (Rna) polymerase ii associated protein n=1 Tax=Holotrichia oblita TaxID=644536 RepID=A0ACB9TFN5_HOLOL|nr:rna (rna) polymerase ii associated protein [Holotrichia oblita]